MNGLEDSVNMLLISKLISKFDAVSIKIPKRFFFFVDIGKFFIKFTWKGHKARITI